MQSNAHVHTQKNNSDMKWNVQAITNKYTARVDLILTKKIHLLKYLYRAIRIEVSLVY